MAGNSKSRFKVNSFFAGIGGFDLSFQLERFKPVFHCEIEPYCRSVLKRHWQKLGCVSNILDVTPEKIPDAEVWCGGFPCQDVSVARGWLGRDGLKGKNTGLFFPFAQLVNAKLPQVVVMENVTGLLNSHNGHDFAVILRTFEAMGYGVAWRILNTRYFGAPQSRPRVFICAWKGSGVRAFSVLYEAGPTFHPENQRHGFLRPSNITRTGAMVPEVAFCLAATSGRHTGTDWSRSYVSYHDEVRRLTPTECERLQGFPEGWTLPGEDFHLNDDEIDTLRYHAIGNAVSVPVVKWVARRIRSELQQTTPQDASDASHWSTHNYALNRVQDFIVKRASIVDISSLVQLDNAPKIKWLSGGVMFGGYCLMAPVSAAPNNPVNSVFADVLDVERPSSRYFLSANAATGILRRVASQDRQLFGPLDAALKRLSAAQPAISKSILVSPTIAQTNYG